MCSSRGSWFADEPIGQTLALSDKKTRWLQSDKPTGRVSSGPSGCVARQCVLGVWAKFGSTHTEGGKLYRKVKHRSPPKSFLMPTAKARPVRQRSRRSQGRGAPHTEHGLGGLLGWGCASPYAGMWLLSARLWLCGDLWLQSDKPTGRVSSGPSGCVARQCVLCVWVKPHRERQTIPQGQTSKPAQIFPHANGQSAPGKAALATFAGGAERHTPSTASEVCRRFAGVGVCFPLWWCWDVASLRPCVALWGPLIAIRQANRNRTGCTPGPPVEPVPFVSGDMCRFYGVAHRLTRLWYSHCQALRNLTIATITIKRNDALSFLGIFTKWCVGAQPEEYNMNISFACLSREVFEKWLHAWSMPGAVVRSCDCAGADELFPSIIITHIYGMYTCITYTNSVFFLFMLYI